MTQEKLKQYKTKLESERRLVSEEIKGTQKPVTFGADVDSFDEKTDEAEEVGNQMAIAQNLKDRLNEIDIALEKIHSGKFGTCERCGNKIEEEILDIDPESRFCKKCKQGM
jgi:RNA polymerase-binding transcription factor DksA